MMPNLEDVKIDKILLYISRRIDQAKWDSPQNLF